MLSFNEFRQEKVVLEACCGSSYSSDCPLELKADVLKRVGQLAKSNAIKELGKDLMKLSKKHNDATYRINSILEDISLRAIINMYDFQSAETSATSLVKVAR